MTVELLAKPQIIENESFEHYSTGNSENMTAETARLN